MKCLRYFTAFIFILCFSIPAFAHGGSTDENGGHVDWENGEYHYHHGYPAHQHTNGICPYEWEDNTNTTYNSNTSSNSYNYNYDNRDKYVPDYHPTPAPTPTPKYHSKGQYSNPIKDYNEQLSQKDTSFDWSVLFLVVPIGFAVLWKKQQKSEAEYQQSLIAKKQFEEQKAKYSQLYGGKDILTIINAPPTAFIDSNGMPHQSVKNDDIFVIYLAPKQPRVFHKHKSCGKNLQKANYINLWRYKQEITPCKKCNPIVPDTSWYYEYLKIKQIKEKYKIE